MNNMAVKVFKMINGEEIISEVLENLSATPGTYSLKSPATIVMQQTEKGVGVGIAPYMPYADGTVVLYKSAIASEGKPDVKMENEYSRLFGSGIQIAPAGSIVTG
jgi:hypothetical protein